MIAYKIMHKPTGFFLCPTRRIRSKLNGVYTKSNLSKVGKVYHKEPSIKQITNWWIGPSYSHLSASLRNGKYNIFLNIEDLEIVEV